MPLPAMLQRIWELQDNVTPYDAAYIALAEPSEARQGSFCTSASSSRELMVWSGAWKKLG